MISAEDPMLSNHELSLYFGGSADIWMSIRTSTRH